MSGTPPSLSGIPPVSGIPPHYCNCTTVWNPITCLEPYPIPCLVSHPSALLPPSCLQYPALIWPLLLLSDSYSLIWLLPAHYLELHATPITPATAIWPSCTLPSPPQAIWPSFSHCPSPIWLPAISLLSHHPCHLALLPQHPPAPPPPATAIRPSCPLLSLPSLPSGTPGPNSLSHLAPCHCPSYPNYSHPNLELLPTPHQISSPKVPSTQKGNLSFSEFPSFSMFVLISNLSPRVKKFPKKSHSNPHSINKVPLTSHQ